MNSFLEIQDFYDVCVHFTRMYSVRKRKSRPFEPQYKYELRVQ